MSAKSFLSARVTRAGRAVFSITLAMLLAACNSGSGNSGASQPATELPFSVEVKGPLANNALGTAVSFSANVADPSGRLKYEWRFGDGETSTLANPTHSYAKAGVYRVQLIVTNEVGATRVSSADVSVADSSVTSNKLCSGDSGSGWCWQMPLPTGNILSDYAYIDQLHGWAVGEMGTILVTGDGGLSWQQQNSGTELPLSKVVFNNVQEGWVVASNGTILKTANGGVSWSSAGYLPGIAPGSFGASDTNTAWAVGEYQRQVSITRDGGASWSPVAPPSLTSGYVLQYYPVNTSVIWALTYDTDVTVLRTANGGASWETSALPSVAAGLSRRINEVIAMGPNDAWLVCDESGSQDGSYLSRKVLLKTADGGKTWQVISPNGSTLQFLQFANANVGFAVENNERALLRSRNGGVSWERLPLPNSLANGVSRLKALSQTHLRLSAYDESVYVSKDGGDSWQQEAAGRQPYFNITGLWFFDNREGIATGSDGSIARTTDGGQTWVKTAGIDSSTNWGRPQFMADGTGWVLATYSNIYRSTDKGKTWMAPVAQNGSSIYGVADFHFIDANHGWLVKSYPTGEGSQLASILRSTDGGLSWVPVEGTGNYQGLNSIRFADASNGIAVGSNGLVLVTTDGGKKWSPRTITSGPALNRVTFIDGNVAVAVGAGGVIMRSADRGQTWKKMPAVTINTLYDVRFVSPKFGWAVGEAGTVLATRDGGLTWSVQTTVAGTSFNNAFFIDEQTGWIAGSGGAIMATSTGGR